MNKLIILPNKKICPYGKLIKLKNLNNNLCDILINNNINIPHFCEKVGRCTTCCIIVKEGYYLLNNLSFEENYIFNKINYLNLVYFIRLSCQVFLLFKSNLIIFIPI